MKRQKKEPLLNGSLYFSGTKALCADMKFACLSAAYVNSDALNVDEPATSRVTIRMAYGVAYCRTAAAAITIL